MTRDAKSHRRAKLKALAYDLMNRFAVLEAEQLSEGKIRSETKGALSTPKPWHSERGTRSSKQVMTVMATKWQEVQEDVIKVCPNSQHNGKGPSMASMSSEQLPEATTRCSTVGAYSTPRSRHTEKG